MPDFLRPAVYPLLLTCIVGSLWMLGRSAAAPAPDYGQPSRAWREFSARHPSDPPTTHPVFAELDLDGQ